MSILTTTIKTSKETKKRLLKFKERRTECFDDIINNLIDKVINIPKSLGNKK